MIKIVDQKLCTGCEACYNICPTQAIEMTLNRVGFYYPEVIKEKCTKCGQCLEVCPVFNEVKADTNEWKSPQVFAAWSLNKGLRITSTSGGIFSELAKQILSEGGLVVGAKYDKSFLVEHDIVHTLEGLEKLKQSKYVQSRIKGIFKKVQQELKTGKVVAFAGCPCQVYGLLQFLRHDYNNLITFDFICRGVNSPKVYSEYLKALERQHGSKIKRVWFKNKTYGWNLFSTRVDFEDGQVYIQNKSKDAFMLGYLRKTLYMRKSCYNCQFRVLPRRADITLADFWKVDKSLDQDLGTSAVLINSLKGMILFNKIKSQIFCQRKTFAEVFRGNKCLLNRVIEHPDRLKFLRMLENHSFEDSFNKFG